MNIIDRAIAYVAPRAAAARHTARLRLTAASGYDAARRELAALDPGGAGKDRS
jgi:hypothetical protein